MKKTSGTHLFALALLALFACERGPTAHPDEGATGEEGTAEVDGDVLADAPSVERLAKRLDSGSVDLLSDGLPRWLTAGFIDDGARDDPKAAFVQANRDLQGWFDAATLGGDAAMLDGLPALARATLLAEMLVTDFDNTEPEVLILLERIYRMLDAPELVHNRDLIEQLLGSLANLKASQGDGLSPAELEEAAKFMLTGIERAHGLHRATVASLLRVAPEHPELPEILRQTAIKIFNREPELAVGLLKRAVVLSGEAATPELWISLAQVCHRALDSRCGTEARSRAEPLLVGQPSEDLADALAIEQRLARAATQVIELRDARELEPSLALAGAWSELLRPEKARTIYERLTVEYPEDARPWLGLVRAGLSSQLDFGTAFGVLERARPREHLDRDWYEMTIGIRATALAYHMLPQLADQSPEAILDLLRPTLVQMDRDIDALVALDADEGHVLRFLYDVGMEVLPEIQRGQWPTEMIQGLLPRVQALRAVVPNSRHAYTMELAAAEFVVDRSQALAVLDTPAPKEHADGLQVRRLNAAIDLIATWDAADATDVLLARAAAADQPEYRAAERRLVLDAHVIAHNLGAPQDLAALEGRYRALLGEAGPSGLLLNNLAVVVALRGDVEAADALWAQAQESTDDGEQSIVAINRIAAKFLVPGLPPSKDDHKALKAIIEREKTNDVGLVAHAWMAALTSGAQRSQAKSALKKAVAIAAKEALRPRWPGKSGVLLRGSLEAGLGYAGVQGMQLNIDTTGVPWLTVPCPVAIPDPRAK